VSGLPSGSVTFLFSDIEGSTRLVKALRDGYAEVLAGHRRLVRAAIAAHAGHEVDTQGDAFFAAFGGAKQAVLCALEIQRVLAGSSRNFGLARSPVLARAAGQYGTAQNAPVMRAGRPQVDLDPNDAERRLLAQWPRTSCSR
jgi:class 3 adenylate cyclase